MHIPGSHLLKRLRSGGNIVAMAGPFVIKRVGGSNPRRKFYSETTARQWLSQAGVATVPIRLQVGVLNTFVMQRAAVPTLNRSLTENLLAAFADHVIVLSTLRLPPSAPAGYYWLDEPAQRRAYATYGEFLARESITDPSAFRVTHPAVELEQAEACFLKAEQQPERLLVLTDIAPKNVVHHDGRFTHLDLEVTLVGPPEFLLVKAAMNLASDVGDRFGGRSARRRLLDHCASRDNARAALVFALLRRMVYEAHAGRTDPRAGRALQAALSGRALDEAITWLEGSWDVDPVSAEARPASE
jgi:hypothetical protein